MEIMWFEVKSSMGNLTATLGKY